jgi:hypothetical protein
VQISADLQKHRADQHGSAPMLCIVAQICRNQCIFAQNSKGQCISAKTQCRLALICTNYVHISADLKKPMHICTKQQGFVQICTNTGQISMDLLIRNLFKGYTQLGHKIKKGITCPIPEEPGYYYTMC